MEKTKKEKPDKRTYTIMLVPHQGAGVKSIKIPIKTIKVTAGLLCASLIIAAGATINFGNTVRVAQSERSELLQLRNVNGQQKSQIVSLAKETTSLQQNMERLIQLESEVRRLLNTDESNGVSRSGNSRASSTYNGQGGSNVVTVNQLQSAVKELKVNMKNHEQGLVNLREDLLVRNERLAATPSIWPTEGDVTSRFGWRESPWGGSSDWHPGIDIANDSGTPVCAAAAGIVIRSDWYGGYGQTVEIDHGYGIVTLYGHNSYLEATVGQSVAKGQVISYMGNTGYSTGPHLHYEVRVNGNPVNPAKFL